VFLGIDLGTSSLKALALDVDGTIVGSASAAYSISTPQPGWAESNPDDWWTAVGDAVTAATAGHAPEIAAVGIAGQMHGVVLSDDTGTPLRPAVLWADTRAARELDAYRELRPELLRTLGNPPATGMAGPTLLWLRHHERQRRVMRRGRCCTT
jgi:xylulokinase